MHDVVQEKERSPSRALNSALLQIPAALNAGLFVVCIAALCAAWWLPVHFPRSTWAWIAGAVAYGALTQPLFGILHECMHDVFSRSRLVNDVAGVMLAIFMPSSFRMIRYVHLGHHMANRSKRERIEYYAEGESRLKQSVFFYAVLMGLNWFGFVSQNIAFTFLPIRLIRRWKLDTSLASTLPSLSDAQLRLIAVEFAVVVAAHVSLLVFTPVTARQYLLYTVASAFCFSQARFVFHYEASFDVVEGTFNLRAPRWFRLFMLNANYHLTHHRHPKVPWVHLEQASDEREMTYGLFERWRAQWRGVHPESSQANREGRVIQWNGDSMFPPSLTGVSDKRGGA